MVLLFEPVPCSGFPQSNDLCSGCLSLRSWRQKTNKAKPAHGIEIPEVLVVGLPLLNSFLHLLQSFIHLSELRHPGVTLHFYLQPHADRFGMLFQPRGACLYLCYILQCLFVLPLLHCQIRFYFQPYRPQRVLLANIAAARHQLCICAGFNQ